MVVLNACFRAWCFSMAEHLHTNETKHFLCDLEPCDKCTLYTSSAARGGAGSFKNLSI